MASLGKIKICGIRSFGPNEDDVQTIRFQKPLTLILGENGCGKSTIIECLRYLTAQKEPAGKGTFVHDPSLTGRTTVKAFVKLQITDPKGHRVDLCRQLQSTKTKKTITTRSLDNVITRVDKNTKEKQSISNRCADFTYEISRIFGVSRAILENVIFCTQEDSHWPLETDQKLKEKFDQIFDSEKFNKCVGKFREQVKKIKEKCKISEVEIKYLESNKKIAGEKRREIEKTKKKIQESEDEIAQLNSSLKPIDMKLKEINEREMEMSKNHTLKETKKAELTQLENYLSELKSRMGAEFEGTDEELRDKLQNFGKQLQLQQKEISTLEDKVSDCNKQEAKISKDIMNEQGKLGQLQKEEEINRERVNDRNQNLTTLAALLEFESCEMSQDSEDSVQRLLSKVQSAIRTKEKELGKLKEKYDDEESSMQRLIDRSREEYTEARNEVTNKERDMKNREAEMSKIKRELNEIEQAFSELSVIKNQLSRKNKRIEELQNKVNVDELKDDIQKNLNERNKIEDRLSEIDETVRILQQNASAAAELEVQRELVSNKDSDIQRLNNKHKDSLKSLLGEVPVSGYKIAVQNHADKLKRSIKELSNMQIRKEKELTELELKRKHQKDQLRQKEEELRSFEEEIYEECGSDDFDETVTSLQSQIDDLQDVKGTLSSSEFMYQRYIQALQKPQPCCPLCHRDFNREGEAQVLVEELTLKVREVPNKLLENKNDLEEKQNKFHKLLSLRSKHDQILTLKTVTLPKMRSELEKMESSLKKLKKELEEIGNKILPLQTDESVCISLQGDMALLDQLQLEKKKIGWEIDKLESRLGSSKKTGGNLDEAFEEQESLRKKLKRTRNIVEELQTQLNNHNEELQTEQASKNSLMEQLNKIEAGAGKKKQLDDRFDELQALELMQIEELDNLKEESSKAQRSLNDMISKRDIQKTKASDEIDKLSKLLNTLEKKLQDIENANDHVKMYGSKGIAKKLESAQKLIKKLEIDLTQMKTNRENANKTISELKRIFLNQESLERELEDNLKYREKSRYSESLKKEVAALEKKCGNINFDEIMREKRKLKTEEEEIGRKKACIQGRMGELDVRIEQLQTELSGKTLKNVEADFKKELVKLVVLKCCAKDLEKYATTMEYAMMTYHKEQMKRVNAFAREYWRSIYNGNDIEYIEIQMDNIASTEKRRNYNYKVVQRRDDNFLDMRNRCSAGQKMLASLIIRMALAETFSGNCGIMTLDEPTTNLDRKNIRNLAEMLGELLKRKRRFVNTNFQLIVITHDEEFLRHLMAKEEISEYVRVSRNSSGVTRVAREIFTCSIPRMGHFVRMPPRSDENQMEELIYD